MFKKLFGKKDAKPEKNQVSDDLNLEVNEEKGFATILREGYQTGKTSHEFLEVLSDQNDIPIFKGIIEHAYESDFLGYKDKCPRCDSPTQQMMSNFPYATQEEPRIMSTPAGHFCPDCPTVIIDDDMMKESINPKFNYRGVFNIDTGYKQTLFKTLNGEKTVYILTEDQDIAGIVQSVHQNMNSGEYDYIGMRGGKPILPTATLHKRKSGNKKKKKAARKARKKNRRK